MIAHLNPSYCLGRAIDTDLVPVRAISVSSNRNHYAAYKHIVWLYTISNKYLKWITIVKISTLRANGL